MSFDSMLSAALDKKYSIMQQQANADTTRANAALLGAQSAANGIGITPTDPLQGLREQQLAAQIKEENSQTNLNNTNASATDDLNRRSNLATDQAFNSGQFTADDAAAKKKADAAAKKSGVFGFLGFAKGTAFVPVMPAKAIPKGMPKKVAVKPGGTSKVPGKGSGKVDTMNAKLAPGEAVLNKGAAQIAGRGLIAHLNKVGKAKMGMP